MFLIVGTVFLILLTVTLLMLWAHERAANKRVVPRAKIEECWDGDERREHSRFKKALEVEYAVEKKAHLKNGAGKTVDISKGGMKLLMDEKLNKGAIVDLKISVPGRSQAIELEGEIMWTKDAEIKDPSGKRFFHSGIRFIAVKEPHGARLSEYVASLE